MNEEEVFITEEEKKDTYDNYFEVKEGKLKKLKEVPKWLKEHKDLVIALAPCIIGGAVEIVKVASKKATVNEEKRLKDCYVYDRNHGHYYELAKKPTSSQWLQIDYRRDSGESLSDILDGMHILK